MEEALEAHNAEQLTQHLQADHAQVSRAAALLASLHTVVNKQARTAR